MATDTTPPAAEQPDEESPQQDAEAPEPEAAGYVQPEVDVPALTALLDGRYADVRQLVRTNLVEYASILEEAESLDRAAFRERVGIRPRDGRDRPDRHGLPEGVRRRR